MPVRASDRALRKTGETPSPENENSGPTPGRVFRKSASRMQRRRWSSGFRPPAKPLEADLASA